MNKILYSISIILTILTLNSCASFSTATSNTNKWLAKEVRPSQIKTNGDIFLEGKLSDGSTFSVFMDETISIDGYYYYASLMQDFGWTSNGDKWTGYDVRHHKIGHIYINPKRRVAVYFYPKGTFDAFKVKITSSIY